jgi:undecaprenyl-diphosphatase
VDALQAIVLGIVQGLTEFLPVSSTAHLRIVPAFFGWDDPGAAFAAVVQLGTLAAVLVYFRRDLWTIASAWVRSARARERAPQDPDARLGWYIILGTIPIAVLGLAFKNQIEDQFRTLELIGSALVLFSFVMLRAEAVSRRDRELSDITRRDGWIIGGFQALALVPGVSRSGATISAGLFLNFDRTAAARYSFLLSVPAVVLNALPPAGCARCGGSTREAGALRKDLRGLGLDRCAIMNAPALFPSPRGVARLAAWVQRWEKLTG